MRMYDLIKSIHLHTHKLTHVRTHVHAHIKTHTQTHTQARVKQNASTRKKTNYSTKSQMDIHEHVCRTALRCWLLEYLSDIYLCICLEACVRMYSDIWKYNGLNNCFALANCFFCHF